MQDITPIEPMRRVRYYLGRSEDALDSATTTLQHSAGRLDDECLTEFVQDIIVLRAKLDIFRTLMNGK